ncbi:MAG: radical SAM protein, partial [Dehalococcoidia bacterium]
ESCTYCEVIQQFVGYRMVKPEVEIKRIQQLQEMAAEGLIYRSPRDGRVATFVSDDLHAPPSRARKFRDNRLERARNWKGHTEGMFFISQNRAELGSDQELAEAFLEVGMGMLYIGVESSSAENLKAVKKRQEPDQMHRDLESLQSMGFDVVAMTIIGLPYDDEEQVTQLAEWVRGVSRFQTANLLTPLPATINWPNAAAGTGLKLINGNGDLLNGDGSYNPYGELPPYELFTGRQFVHQDDGVVKGQPRNWTLQESREVYKRYIARLRPVDKLYERIFQMMKRRAEKVEQETHERVAIPVRV